MSDEQEHHEINDGWSSGRASGAPIVKGHDDASPLKPNKATISNHLYALFPHHLVANYPDCWIEIATASKATDWKPKTAEHFTPFDLRKAVEYAEKINRPGTNVYIGPSLRQGETGPSGRSTDENYLDTGFAWADFDGEGDFDRISEILKANSLTNAVLVMTGTVPHKRAHVYFKLTGKITAAQIKAINAGLKKLLGTDDVDDPCRLMRLAGTVSYPSTDKVERGYVPEMVTLHIRKDAPSYAVEQLLGIAGETDPIEDLAKENKRGRSDDQIIELLEASKVDGQWHNSIRDAMASMIGYNWSDLQIKLACAPYCTEKYADVDLVPMIEGARKKWNKPDPTVAKQDSNARIKQLAQLSQLEYGQSRATEAKALGIRVGLLDSLVGEAREKIARSKDKTDTAAIDPEVARINKKHALVLAGNKAVIMKFEDATKFRLLQVDGGFRQWFANQFVTTCNDVRSIADYWLTHSQRRQYAGIEFAPPGTAATLGYYNLFQGFAVTPKQGDCSKFLAHLKDNVARGDEKTYLWIVGWWAQIFQQPSIKMETALALRGGFGTGKTKVGEVFGSLMRSHYLLVASPRYITGQFNSHMASLLLLHADEAFWAGDKRGEGTLKDLVSGKTHQLEYKGIDAINIRNFIRLFVTGNLDWIVPAGFRDRRWAIFDIGEARMQDHKYFAAIDDEMANGGREALLHHLLNFDLSQVDLRTIPRTAALFDQQIESLTPEQAWWLDTLMRGTLPPAVPDTDDTPIKNTCVRADLYASYVQHARLQGTNHRSIEVKIGMFLNNMLGTNMGETRLTVGNKRPRCYVLPSLVVCREIFAEKMGQTIDWDDALEEWQHADPEPARGDWDPTGFWATRAARSSS